MTIRQHKHDIDWPELVAVDPARVVEGSPTNATVSVFATDVSDFGFWKATPGKFRTYSRAGFYEWIHILEGEGDLVSMDGTVTHLTPGTGVYIEQGWDGYWDIRETLVKTYATTTLP